jgi:hypothetical protein
LTEKNDAALPPTDPNAIQAVTPSDIFSWQGPTESLTRSSGRIAAEQKWYAVTGRVVAVKAEMDGDLHIALQDATGEKPGIVVVEVPEKPQWCSIRETVFSWTRTKFPFHTSSAKKLKITNPPIITIVGKAFFERALSKRSIEKPKKKSSRLLGLGNSPGDETNSPVTRVYDAAGNVIEMHEQRRVSKTDGRLNLLLWRIDRDFRHT